MGLVLKCDEFSFLREKNMLFTWDRMEGTENDNDS